MITLNQQPPEPLQSELTDGSLDVHSIFATLQGEGPFAGCPAVFVRVAGCQLACNKCDTIYTTGRKMMTPTEILDEVAAKANPMRKRLIVLTGGEPFRQGFGQFAALAADRGYHVQVETNGALFQAGVPFGPNLSIVCSPKTPKLHPKLVPHLTDYKYVLQAGAVDPSDGLPTYVMENPDLAVARPVPGRLTQIWVQPLDEQDPERNKLNLAAAVESCLKFGYRLSIQTHKIAGLD